MRAVVLHRRLHHRGGVLVAVRSGHADALPFARLEHYFSTYKLRPGEPSHAVIRAVYNREHAFRVVRAALEDYEENYGDAFTTGRHDFTPLD